LAAAVPSGFASEAAGAAAAEAAGGGVAPCAALKALPLRQASKAARSRQI